MQNIDKSRFYDVVVVGGGPAGLTAALYLARARLRVLVVEKDHFGGQITITSEVVNFPGVKKVSGEELANTIREQASDFGAEFLLASVDSIDAQGDIRTVHTSRGDIYCHAILIATGAAPRRGGFEGEEEYRGRGIGYCATCDGSFFTGKDVFVVGGGFAAAEESVFLTKYARHVTILMRGADFSCAKSVADGARNSPKITIIPHTQITKVSSSNGTEGIDTITTINNQTNEVKEYKAQGGDSYGVFVFAGYAPATSLLKGVCDLDENGYVITDDLMATSAPGIYAAGDLRVKKLRQVVTAAGDGAIAASALEHYCATRREVTGLVGERPQQLANEGQAHSVSVSSETKNQGNNPGNAIFDDAMLAQLTAVFARMENPLVLEVHSNGNDVSTELLGYMKALSDLTDKLSLVEGDGSANNLPCVRIMRDGKYTGLAFHGVPGGHEFTSFVLGLYNASGTGQQVDGAVLEKAKAISSEVNLKVLVSLSCTMCPELVTACQKLACLNNKVTAEVYDINHFPELREKYNVMSVPCLVINDLHITFGRKNLAQLLEVLREKGVS